MTILVLSIIGAVWGLVALSCFARGIITNDGDWTWRGLMLLFIVTILLGYIMMIAKSIEPDEELCVPIEITQEQK